MGYRCFVVCSIRVFNNSNNNNKTPDLLTMKSYRCTYDATMPRSCMERTRAHLNIKRDTQAAHTTIDILFEIVCSH